MSNNIKPILNWDDDDINVKSNKTTGNGGTQTLEEELYKLLRIAMERAKSAAKAVARIEFDLVTEEKAEEPADVPEEEKDDSMSRTASRESTGEFDQSDFISLFNGLSNIKFTIDLLRLLEMSDVKDEVVALMLDSMFAPKVEKVGQQSHDRSSTVVGNEMDILLHNIKKAVAAKQRSGKND